MSVSRDNNDDDAIVSDGFAEHISADYTPVTNQNDRNSIAFLYSFSHIPLAKNEEALG